MRRSDSGAGTGKALFALLVVAAVAFVAIKTIPVYVHNYELQDFIRDLAIRATVEHSNADAIRDAVLAQARELDLPVTRDDVKVTPGNRVTIDINYKVPVDLKVYTLVLHFTPSAENRAI